MGGWRSAKPPLWTGVHYRDQTGAHSAESMDDLGDAGPLSARTVTTETTAMGFAKVRVAGSNPVVRSREVGAHQVRARVEADGSAVICP